MELRINCMAEAQESHLLRQTLRNRITSVHWIKDRGSVPSAYEGDNHYDIPS